MVCAICHRGEDLVPLTNLPCCKGRICEDCVSPRIAAQMSTSLFHRLNHLPFLTCPTGCGALLQKVTRPAYLRVWLTLRGATRDVELYERLYARALAVREAVRRVVRGLDNDRAALAAELHRDLHAAGVARHVLSLDDDEELEVMRLPVLRGGAVTVVPAVVSLLHSREVRTCSICAEDTPVVPILHPQAWRRLVEKYKGNVHILGSRFPLAETLPACAAAHELDVCKTCISKYVEAQMDTRRLRAVGDIACLAADCAYIYTHEDISALADVVTAAKYDSLALKRLLEGDTSYRECLRADCEYGAFYDTSPDCCRDVKHSADKKRALGAAARAPNRIECGKCHYNMCFNCKVRWHQGLTCEQYRAQAGSGDATAAWLALNTKQCPGESCSAPVQKGPDCFHMTCTVCSYQWCWVCQGKWLEIFPPLPGSPNPLAHREGCFFREEGAPLPIHRSGETIVEAVARHEAGEE